jgi:hypothetical protein
MAVAVAIPHIPLSEGKKANIRAKKRIEENKHKCSVRITARVFGTSFDSHLLSLNCTGVVMSVCQYQPSKTWLAERDRERKLV